MFVFLPDIVVDFFSIVVMGHTAAASRTIANADDDASAIERAVIRATPQRYVVPTALILAQFPRLRNQCCFCKSKLSIDKTHTHSLTTSCCASITTVHTGASDARRRFERSGLAALQSDDIDDVHDDDRSNVTHLQCDITIFIDACPTNCSSDVCLVCLC
jgi:hypothetical protein